jgi:serine/threonine protein phosphatase 1
MSLIEVYSPRSGRLFAVGDIHGCARELVALLEHLESCSLTTDDTVIFLGDYIDRGPHSRLVIAFLLDFAHRYPSTIFLMGNHEEMLLHALTGERVFVQQYLINGGEQTLRSYGITHLFSPQEVIGRFPPQHLEFIQKLRYGVKIGSYLFVHAGIHPYLPLEEQTGEHILWIRDEFINAHHKHECLVLFGHTPFRDIYTDMPYKVGLDTGLVYGNALTCYEVTQQEIIQVRAGPHPTVFIRTLEQSAVA